MAFFWPRHPSNVFGDQQSPLTCHKTHKTLDNFSSCKWCVCNTPPSPSHTFPAVFPGCQKVATRL